MQALDGLFEEEEELSDKPDCVCATSVELRSPTKANW